MTDEMVFPISAEAFNARDAQRREDMAKAAKLGVHFWIAAALYRVSGPSEDAILDAENICGYTQVHCALCGVDTNDDPRCHLIG